MLKTFLLKPLFLSPRLFKAAEVKTALTPPFLGCEERGSVRVRVQRARAVWRGLGQYANDTVIKVGF